MTRRIGVILGHLLVYLLTWAGLVLLIAGAGIRFYWGEISVNQMLLNLVSVETDGGGGALVWMGILGIGVAPLLITALIAAWRLRRRRRRHNGEGLRTHRAEWLVRAVSAALVAALVTGGTTAFSTAVGMADYLRAAVSKYNLGDYYVEPAITGGTDKRNLVLIYLEAGEATFGDVQLFEKDAFAPLNEATPAAEGWQSVEGFQQYEGGGWTMAGFVATQCGIPLKGAGSSTGSGATDWLSGNVAGYLRGSVCLGDVLAGHGYTNVFLGGANGAFAGKDTFLSSHGYSEQKGLSDWRAANEPETSFRSDWGLSDERLMAHARDEIDELHAEAERTGQPFNLTMLTLDTHDPVHRFDYCPVDTQAEALSVFSCSMAQVAGFVNHMKEKGYLDDTAVVIMGDHLKPMSAGDPFHEQLDGNGNRTIFNRIWIPGAGSGAAPAPIPGTVPGTGNTMLRPHIDQLNMYPTILEAAGLTLQDHEAGLGVSAFAAEVPDRSAQSLEPDVYAELLHSASPQFYADAWILKDPP
ncbi:sulfatase-like hydrolase/transferase [Arthrobacter sp. zg-ZUI100]|uniref:sulfatase-like hydrolase/transferase n=1 Tax=Arthrobacter jiangjiafuii TaxID=2817475 RepID=UPI001AEEC29C|nr:sulfatase-like hydrolase/transferase [Arthrobacter jiangjiafuii]MBP3037578.1 sulfatase-like hydrolase/transferase [Arthrobacter jiangjiafuii]